MVIRDPERAMQVAQGTAFAAGVAPYVAPVIRHFAHRLRTRITRGTLDRARSYVNRLASRAKSFFARPGAAAPPPPAVVRSYAPGGRYTRYRFPRKYGNFRTYRRRRYRR